MCVCVFAAMLTEADGCKYLYMYQQKKPEPYLEEFKFRNWQVKPTYNLQKSYRIIKIYVSGVKILTHTQIMRYNVSLSFSLLKNLKCSPVA